MKKSFLALEHLNLNQLIVSGGVGANKKLREKLIKLSLKNNFKVSFPAFEFCTDNGAMIALAGALRYHLSAKNDFKYTVKPRWRLSEI